MVNLKNRNLLIIILLVLTTIFHPLSTSAQSKTKETPNIPNTTIKLPVNATIDKEFDINVIYQNVPSYSGNKGLVATLLIDNTELDHYIFGNLKPNDRIEFNFTAKISEPGDHKVKVRILWPKPSSENRRYVSESEEYIIKVLDPMSDSDDDGLTDQEEMNLGTNPSISDTDKDGLSDGEEVLMYKTNPLKSDTDEDRLPDQYEIFATGTDPLIIDSDKNGINDSEEDMDRDNLSNIKELEIGTDPNLYDTDFDGLSDSDELNQKTNPFEYDTDNDKLSDGEEGDLGFNPTLTDTDGNGIIDGDEVIPVTTVPIIEDSESMVNASVTLNTIASEASTTTVTSLKGNGILNEKIPGYLGEAYEFETDVQFSEATIVFSYDSSLISEDFEPKIYYFNEEEQRLEEINNQVHDPNSRTVTGTVNHFSKYILLNGKEYEKAWEKDIRPPDLDQNGQIKNIEVVFSIDSSGSMSWMDPYDLRKQATKDFVEKLSDADRAAVVDFDDTAKILVHLTTNKQEIKDVIDSIDRSGGTNLYNGVKAAIDEIVANGKTDHSKYIIFLTDGDGSWSDSVLQLANENKISIYTVGLGNGVNKTLLEKIATTTGGKYFFATDANKLEEALKNTASDTVDYTLDDDKDGIPNYLEIEGIRNGAGTLFKTDPNNSDTDGDGLLDGEEILVQYKSLENKIYFTMISDPTVIDTDGDGLSDFNEVRHNNSDPINLFSINSVSSQRTKYDPLVYDFTPEHALMLSELSYVDDLESMSRTQSKSIDFKNVIYTKRSQINNGNFHYESDTYGNKLDDWYLIKAEDSNWIDSGFGAFAVLHGDKIVITFRGSDNILSLNLINDWIFGNLNGILFEGNSKQATYAKSFAESIAKKYPKKKIFINGHSLGGWLAQVASYHLENNNIGNYQYTRTFNAAPFFGTKALRKIGINIDTSRNPVVPLNVATSSSYDDKIFNNAMSFDILYLLDHHLNEDAFKLGAEGAGYTFYYKNLTPTDFDFQFLVDAIQKYEEEIGEISDKNRVYVAAQLNDAINNVAPTDQNLKSRKEIFDKRLVDANNAHSLIHFYDYIENIK
ncbi:VWA domain-containing protein [Schinkia azotoformans]|uniref:von willebrand factor type a n=1 Tax=Schinkia azotoformans LMG 9581 TaxID=1131731 RepID=K6CV75_SCHAZ|nr:VWA domain-containing protein [Schinkia azotoformans]EKN64127.1 von willebrand factor type a [Schinkia azotoformans LMG 9581]MEC1637127.1 VWA domain-containing protein [Schinkia azotoformans]MEC1945427.1 VWA domain-containing protein [Schinkia azotoformans]